jgi:hypothetical protein
VKSVSTLWAVADLAVAAAIDGRVLLMEGRRSTWQSWHIRAEAHRRIRVAAVPTDKVEHLVELLVAEVLQTRSISLARPDDASQSLRSCVESTVPVSPPLPDPSCSPQPDLAAEQRLVAMAPSTTMTCPTGRKASAGPRW